MLLGFLNVHRLKGIHSKIQSDLEWIDENVGFLRETYVKWKPLQLVKQIGEAPIFVPDISSLFRTDYLTDSIMDAIAEMEGILKTC